MQSWPKSSENVFQLEMPGDFRLGHSSILPNRVSSPPFSGKKYLQLADFVKTFQGQKSVNLGQTDECPPKVPNIFNWRTFPATLGAVDVQFPEQCTLYTVQYYSISPLCEDLLSCPTAPINHLINQGQEGWVGWGKTSWFRQNLLPGSDGHRDVGVINESLNGYEQDKSASRIIHTGNSG